MSALREEKLQIPSINTQRNLKRHARSEFFFTTKIMSGGYAPGGLAVKGGGAWLRAQRRS
jgi:hypothetical protein